MSTLQENLLQHSGHLIRTTRFTSPGSDSPGTFEVFCNTCKKVLNGVEPISTPAVLDHKDGKMLWNVRTGATVQTFFLTGHSSHEVLSDFKENQSVVSSHRCVPVPFENHFLEPGASLLAACTYFINLVTKLRHGYAQQLVEADPSSQFLRWTVLRMDIVVHLGIVDNSRFILQETYTKTVFEVSLGFCDSRNCELNIRDLIHRVSEDDFFFGPRKRY